MIGRDRPLASGGRVIVASVVAALAFLAGPGPARPWRAEARESVQIAVRQGRLTVKATDMPVERVLAEVARQTGVAIGPPSVLRGRRLTAAFQDVEIEAALARLLLGYDYVLVFIGEAAADAASHPRLSEVRVFPTDTKTAVISSQAVDAANSQPRNSGPLTVSVLLDSLHDPDGAVRVAAIEQLGRSGSGVPVDRVLQTGLGHDDPLTRLAVLTSGVPLPREALIERALHDASPAVRAEALIQLPRNDPGAESVVQSALADADESVRAVAAEVLTWLRPADTRAEAREIEE